MGLSFLKLAKSSYDITQAVLHPVEALRDRLIELAWDGLKPHLADFAKQLLQQEATATRTLDVPLPQKAIVAFGAEPLSRAASSLQPFISRALTQKLAERLGRHVPLHVTLEANVLRVTLFPTATAPTDETTP